MHQNILTAESFAEAAHHECGRLRKAAQDMGLAPAGAVRVTLRGTSEYSEPSWQVSLSVFPPEDENRCHDTFGTGKTLGAAFESAHAVLRRVASDMKRGAA